MMLRGLPVRVPGANRRNTGVGGAVLPGAYGVRTLYAYPQDRGISKGTRGRNTLSIPYASLAKGTGAQKI